MTDQSRLGAVYHDWETFSKEKRQAHLVEMFPELPPYVLKIHSCEVAYTLEPSTFPYRNIDFKDLLTELERVYGLHFRVPNTASLAPIFSDSTQAPLTPDRIGAFLLSSEDPELVFENGLFRMPDDRAIRIERVRFTSEAIHTKVTGPTTAGELLIMELLPLLWALARVRRPWSEISPFHQVTQYATETKAILPNSALSLLSPKLITTLDEWTAAGGIGGNMGTRSVVESWEPPAEANIKYALDELHIRFHRQTSTGFAESTRLRIGIVAKHEYGTGRVTVASELPFREHLDLLASLANIN